jgi:drug/metabolite transporter (DMT)-like permease
MIRGVLTPRIKADLTLVFVAILWGSAFAVQRAVSNQIGVFTFNGLRFLLAGLILSVIVVISGGFAFLNHNSVLNPSPDRNLSKLTRRNFGLISVAGVLLFSASAFQQAGLRSTTAGNAGFITSLYVVLVPILLRIFWRTKIPHITWAGACLAVLGGFLLSSEASLSLSHGGSLVLIGALFWGLHVILVGRVGWSMDILFFACGQYVVAGLLNMSLGLWIEGTELAGISVAGWGIVYTALFSIALGYTLQIFAQKYSPAADAAIILSMEAVFAAIFGFILLGETFSMQQIIGCALILIAIIMTTMRTSKAYPLELTTVEISTEN